MKYIKHFLLILSLFAVLSCSDGSYTADDSSLACYSPKSAIYNTDIYSTDGGGADIYGGDASRSPAAAYTVTFIDNGTVIGEFGESVDDGKVITLPDIRVNHCFFTEERKGMILAGWAVGSDNYTTGSFYKVTGDVTFTSIWEDGVEIYSAAEFDNISRNLSGKYKLMKNINLKDYMADPGWTPIGGEGAPFTGKLYGNGYRIDNLTIDNSTASAAGLFGAIGGKAEIYDLKIKLAADGIKLTAADKDKAVGALAGLIKYENDSNIIIKNVQTSGGEIKADNCSASGYLYAGGLVGRVRASASGGSAHITLDNLSNSIPVSAALSSACNASLGGIIGGTNLTGATASLTSAVNDGKVNLSNTSTSTSLPVHAGGLIGKGENITVEAGANRGVVYVSADSAAAYAGGIAGHISGNNSSIDNCFNDSADNISAESTNTTSASTSHAGGIVGYMIGGGSVTNNRNYDNVTSFSSFYLSYAGGIVGQMENGGLIENDNNTGNIEAKSADVNAYAGGIVGQMQGAGTIENDNNTGRVYAESTSYTAYAGGIVGGVNLPVSSGTATAAINDNSNIGAVRTESKSVSYPYNAYSGGIAGHVQLNASGTGSVTAEAEMFKNSNVGKVEADASTGDAYSGGIAGYVYLSSGSVSVTAKAIIDNCSNIGKVEAGASAGNAFSGGVAGRVNLVGSGTSIATIDNCSNIGSDNISAVSNSTDSAKYSRSGGVVGYMEGGGSIINSRNTDNVTAISPSGNAYSGGIAGQVDGGTIDNDNNTGRVFAQSTSSTAYSGGIVGQVYLQARSAAINNNSNIGAVRTESVNAVSGGIAGYVQVRPLYGGTAGAEINKNSNVGKVETDASSGDAFSGGIAGYVDLYGGGGGGTANATIDDCSNIGTDNISAVSYSTDNTKYSRSGGIVGNLSSGGSITNSRNTDNVTARSPSGNAYAGGIVGDTINSTINNDSNTGKVEASGSVAVSSGGVAGRARAIKIEKSRNLNDVTATSSSSYGLLYSGGIVGYLEGTGNSVTRSYNSGRVYAESTYIDAYSGGIAGYTRSSSSVETSYNTGDVAAKATGTSGDAYSGGIGGKGDSIYYSYNIGSVTAEANGSDDKSYSGGIAGQARWIEICYNTGNVEAAAKGTSGTAYSGGIVGELPASSSVIQCAAVDGKISSIGTTPKIGKIVGLISGGGVQDNFALNPMDLSPSATADSDNGYSKPKSDFKLEGTYKDAVASGGSGGLGWNFSSTWYWDVDHPILKWQIGQ
jgi:hypothetical protein